MPSENFNMDELTEERRKALAASIRTISVDELNTLGREIFPNFDHPWHTAFFDFLAENSGATFHHATAEDGIHVIYCGAKDKGIWFIPGRGKGPLQTKGLAIMKELAAGAA